MIERFLHTLINEEWKDFKVAHHAVIPVQQAKYGKLAKPFPETIQAALAGQGIKKLYTHQASAIDHIRSGANVVVATPTSSGKSLIYNLAICESLLANPEQHALYLFPIKALSRDQLDTLHSLLELLETNLQLRTDVYDGDTTPYKRAKIRQAPPHILITNPDMLHYALLAYHHKWESFWKNLRFIVVDELHTYRGIFGSHVAQIVRRLKRVCKFYGARPQFIGLSATISNPSELAVQLFGSDCGKVTVVRESGAPLAKRNFLFLNPETSLGGHTSGVAAKIIVQAAEAGLKTIAFTQSRRLTELVHMSVQRMAPRLARRVSSYRAGFLPEERRKVEQELAKGKLSAVISTSALEMGIDIGGLDLCILVGYPGTVMSTWQRGGRVGRSGQDSAIILLPQPDALDQYIVNHPEEFLSSHYELAVTDPMNPEILKSHLPCAAAELPLERSEIEKEGELYRSTVEELAGRGILLQTADGERWVSAQMHPHRNVDIRSVGASYTILKEPEDGGKPIPLGKNDGIRALKECHPGAIYLHRGGTYQIKSLDLEKRTVVAVPSQAPYFTRVKSEKETEILEILDSKPLGNFVVRMGHLRVTEHIHGYEMRRLFSQELLGANSLDIPPQTFETVGFWIEIEPILARHIQASGLHYMGGIHAVEHAAISMFPLFALCDRNDIGGISCPQHPQVGKGAIFIYDGYPGGIGLAARGYEIIFPLLEKTRELLASCTCSEGCPSCIHSPKCGSGNKPLDKEAALATLRYLTGELNITDASLPSTPMDHVGPISMIPEQHSSPKPRIGFLDIETQRLASEVGGWQNKHLMRLAVAVLYDTSLDTYRIFKEGEVKALIDALRQLDLVVGFNVLSFDFDVLKAYTPFDLGKLPTLDILKEIHDRVGLRVSLAHLAEKTLGKSKDYDGVQAVTWFREGQWESLIHYCKMDVALTKELFDYAMDKGYLLYCDRQGRLLRIPAQWDLSMFLDTGKDKGNFVSHPRSC